MTGVRWYNWDVATGTVKKPAWFPKSWSGKGGLAKWGWMGEHGSVLYAELLKRNAHESLLFGVVSTHFDPHWDVDVTNSEGKKEGFNAAMKEAAIYAGTDAPQLDLDKRRRAEWFLSAYTDGDWSYSHYVAGKIDESFLQALIDKMLYVMSP